MGVLSVSIENTSKLNLFLMKEAKSLQFIYYPETNMLVG